MAGKSKNAVISGVLGKYGVFLYKILWTGRKLTRCGVLLYIDHKILGLQSLVLRGHTGYIWYV